MKRREKTKVSTGTQIITKTEPRTPRAFYLMYFAPEDKARPAMASTCFIANFNPHINKQMPFQVIKSMPLLSTGEMRSLFSEYYKKPGG